MQRYAIVVLCGVALGVSVQRVGEAPIPEPLPSSPVVQHLGRAIGTMDRAKHSPEYHGSIEFLRAHAPEAVDAVREILHEEKGSFRKWQIAYVIGEFGGEEAVEALRAWVDRPLPSPAGGAEGSHRVDLSYSEELSARAQAVGSMARIATHRPSLHDQVVSNLVEIAKEGRPFKDAALFELRTLLGDDFESLRPHFGPEDARYFDPFMPPPEWHGLLQRRMARHDRERRARAEELEAVCRVP